MPSSWEDGVACASRFHVEIRTIHSGEAQAEAAAAVFAEAVSQLSATLPSPRPETTGVRMFPNNQQRTTWSVSAWLHLAEVQHKAILALLKGAYLPLPGIGPALLLSKKGQSLRRQVRILNIPPEWPCSLLQRTLELQAGLEVLEVKPVEDPQLRLPRAGAMDVLVGGPSAQQLPR